jgi:hypothetical protein
MWTWILLKYGATHTLNNQLMFNRMQASLKRIERVILEEFNLTRNDDLASIDFGNHPMDHRTGSLEVRFFVSLPSANNRIRTVKFARKCRVEIDHATRKLIEKRWTEDVHPASLHDQVWLELRNARGEIGIVFFAGFARITIRFERCIQCLELRVFRTFETIRIFSVRDDQANFRVEHTGIDGVDQRL